MARGPGAERDAVSAPQAARLPGDRLHLHHGPIDLVIGADGPGREAAFAVATARFETILQELVDELPDLRRDVRAPTTLTGNVARAMQAAVLPFAPVFVTPMAAVAGAVADEICAVMAAAGGLRRAYVNNGGDVALHLGAGATFTAAIAGVPGGRTTLGCDSPVRGVATSGWRGRSHSLGIADAVTVLATSAARADAAATLIANAVDLPGHPAIRRVPAHDLAPDSDLGERAVTVDVGPLTPNEVARAIARGADFARRACVQGGITGALICLKDTVQAIGNMQEKEITHA